MWFPSRLAALLGVAIFAAACANFGAAESTSGPHPSPPNESSTQESGMPSIRITIDGQSVSAQLADNPTARDLASQLPITLSFRDLNQVEKIARLPRPLTTDGVPDGDDPEVADIGYYAPSQNLVLYYGDVEYWTGIVRIGQFDSTHLKLVETQPDDFDVTIEQG
jgi:hypothetical protein